MPKAIAARPHFIIVFLLLQACFANLEEQIVPSYLQLAPSQHNNEEIGSVGLITADLRCSLRSISLILILCRLVDKRSFLQLSNKPIDRSHEPERQETKNDQVNGMDS